MNNSESEENKKFILKSARIIKIKIIPKNKILSRAGKKAIFA